MALTSLTNLQPLHVHSVGVSTFDGSVSVGGTLTYEDVTNVDAIGIITARSGLKVTGGQLDVGSNIKLGNAGVITATSFVGSGSGLTGLPAQATIANNADNRVITGGSGVNLNGEANLTFDGTTLTVTGNASANAIQSNYGGITTRLGFVSGGAEGVVETTSNHSLVLGVNSSEKVRITSTGSMGLGTNNPTDTLHVYHATDNYVARFESGDAGGGIALKDNTHTSTILTSNGAFSIDVDNGGDVSGETIAFKMSGSEKLRIDSDGHLHTGYTSSFGQDHVNILASDGGGISIAQNNSGNATSGTVLGSLSIQGYLNTQTHANAEVKISGIAAANHTGSSAAADMVFYTKPSSTGPGSAPTERLRIESDGTMIQSGVYKQRPTDSTGARVFYRKVLGPSNLGPGNSGTYTVTNGHAAGMVHVFVQRSSQGNVNRGIAYGFHLRTTGQANLGSSIYDFSGTGGAPSVNIVQANQGIQVTNNQSYTIKVYVTFELTGSVDG